MPLSSLTQRPLVPALTPRIVSSRAAVRGLAPAAVLPGLPPRGAAIVAALPTHAVLQNPAVAHTVWRSVVPHLSAGSAAAGVIGLVAVGAALEQIIRALPDDVRRQVEHVLTQAGPYLATAALAGVAFVAGQEGLVAFSESRHLVGTLGALLAVPNGLGAIEVITKHWDYHVPALSAPWDWAVNHGVTLGGSAVGGTGAWLAYTGACLLAAGNPWALPLVLGGVSASAGGLEMIGNDQNIAALKGCFSRPVRAMGEQLMKLFESDAAWLVLGAAITAGSAAASLHGVGLLLNGASSPLDALGALEVTAGAFVGALGLGIMDHVARPARLRTQVFEDNESLMGSMASASWAATLGKFAAVSLVATGPGWINVAAAGGAAALACVSVGAAYRQFSSDRPRVDAKIERAVAGCAAGCFGTWSFMLGSHAVMAAQAAAAVPLTHTLGSVLTLGTLAVASAAVGLGALGEALQQRWLGKQAANLGSFALERAGDTLQFAASHPWLVLGAMGAAWFGARGF